MDVTFYGLTAGVLYVFVFSVFTPPPPPEDDVDLVAL
jgi:hypothetical protein